MAEFGMLGLVVALLAGMVSCASPCVLPLIPAHVGYLSGTAANSSDLPGTRGTAPLLHAVSFIAGFTVVLVSFAVSIGLIGFFLRAFKPVERLYARFKPLLSAVSFVSGAMLIVMGVLVFTNSLINVNRYFNFGIFDFTSSV